LALDGSKCSSGALLLVKELMAHIELGAGWAPGLVALLGHYLLHYPTCLIDCIILFMCVKIIFYYLFEEIV
jgi:hypothetical protein